MSKRLFVAGTVITALAAITLLLMAVPSTEAVRIRNALLFEGVSESTIQWAPDNVPGDFRAESGPVPLVFQSFVSDLRGVETPEFDGIEFGQLVGERLVANGQVGGAVQSTSVETLDAIVSKGTGYCADYTQVVNGLAFAAGVGVREWGMSFDGFGGNGHAFNELYDKGLGQWVFFDTFYSFYVVDQATGRPLSALEFRDRLRSSEEWESIDLKPLSASGNRFKTKQLALEYYARGVDQFYLYNGNNVFEYDSSALVRLGARISRSAEQVLAILSGVHPRILIPENPENEAMRAALSDTRRAVTVLALLIAAGMLTVLLATISWLRHRRQG
jgi:hypothetical protein